MRINNRLKKVSDYIPDNSNIIDVGCDHALLDIYLVLNKNNVKCIASDINEGPLLKAKENIKNYSLEDRIIIDKCDGLDNLKTETDTIVISGLGGLSIIRIIKNKKDSLHNIKRIVLSPNTDFYEVRKEITNLGFVIEKEEYFVERDKTYLIISFIKGKKKYSKKELMYGINKDKEYLNSVLKTKKEILSKLPKKRILDRISVKKDIKSLKKMI